MSFNGLWLIGAPFVVGGAALVGAFGAVTAGGCLASCKLIVKKIEENRLQENPGNTKYLKAGLIALGVLAALGAIIATGGSIAGATTLALALIVVYEITSKTLLACALIGVPALALAANIALYAKGFKWALDPKI